MMKENKAKNSNVKSNIITIILVVVLVFALLYFLYSGKIFSKYSNEEELTYSARVAQWNVASDYDGEISDLKQGDTPGTYSFDVNTNSEVKLKYDIIISNVPKDVDVTLYSGRDINDDSKKVVLTNTEENDELFTYIFEDVDIVEPNNNYLTTYTVKFYAQLSAPAGKHAIKIHTKFKQINALAVEEEPSSVDEED